MSSVGSSGVIVDSAVLHVFAEDDRSFIFLRGKPLNVCQTLTRVGSTGILLRILLVLSLFDYLTECLGTAHRHPVPPQSSNQ